MKAAIYKKFQTPLTIQEVPMPIPTDDGVVIQVKACGICRSDWHGWMGNDPDIRLPHVPGHEFAGFVTAIGKNVRKRVEGDRVTLPFVCGCGKCRECASGNQQVCDFQFQPGFTHWGAFAEYVAVDYADTNLVKLPDEMDFVTAASLGCRFITSYRAIVHQGRLSGGEWVAVHGCGGVGLSAIMIANALGGNVIAIDISDEKLDFAASMGATVTVNSKKEDVVESIKEMTGGGAHLSIDALGHPETCFNSIANLRKRGRHIQVGIMEADFKHPSIPMDLVIAKELVILGSHGMQAYKYEEMFRLISSGKLMPQRLIGKTISLEDALKENSFRNTGLTVINKF